MKRIIFNSSTNKNDITEGFIVEEADEFIKIKRLEGNGISTFKWYPKHTIKILKEFEEVLK